MLEVMTIVAAGVVGLTLVAAIVYIVGFVGSVVVSLFTAPYETIKHRHDHTVPI